MLFIIGQSNEITRLVILKLKHTTICPFTGLLETTTRTLATGNFNELGNITGTTIRRMCAAREAITRTFEMVYLIARHLEQPFAIFFAENKGFQGMIARHEITYLVWGYRIPIQKFRRKNQRKEQTITTKATPAPTSKSICKQKSSSILFSFSI